MKNKVISALLCSTLLFEVPTLSAKGINLQKEDIVKISASILSIGTMLGCSCLLFKNDGSTKIKENPNKNMPTFEIPCEDISTTKRTVQTQSQRVPVGITNLGNTCYLNSAIQILYRNQEFRDAILNINTSKKYTNALKWYFEQINKGNTVENKNKYAETLGYDGSQQDAYEHLLKIVNTVQCEIRNNFSTLSLLDPVQPQNIINGIKDINDLYSSDWGDIKNIFLKQKEDALKLIDNKSFTIDQLKEINTDLLKSISEYKEKNYKQFITDFYTQKIKGIKQRNTITINGTVKDIIIPISRSVGIKDTTEIEVPNQITINGKQYQFSRAIIHQDIGTFGGHYYIYSKESDGNWYKINDEEVTNVTTFGKYNQMEDDIAKNCTALVYTLQE